MPRNVYPRNGPTQISRLELFALLSSPPDWWFRRANSNSSFCSYWRDTWRCLHRKTISTECNRSQGRLSYWQGNFWLLRVWRSESKRPQTIFTIFLTLLMAQWVDMEALENKNHASILCFFTIWIWQMSSLESASNRVVTHQHALNACFSASMSTH